jgi:hypothetical protein
VALMLEQVAAQLPELQTLEARVTDLEARHAAAQGRVQGLALKANQARENDLNAEAAALNAGRSVPKPTEPHLRDQLEGAQRDLEVLERRWTMAASDRALYLQQHQGEILGLLQEAHAAEGQRVAAAASEALDALLRYHAAEDEARNLQRLHPAPAPENAGGPESVSVVLGNVSTKNVTGGPRRGDLEGTLRYLQSLGAPTVVEAGAEGDEDAA